MVNKSIFVHIFVKNKKKNYKLFKKRADWLAMKINVFFNQHSFYLQLKINAKNYSIFKSIFY